MSKVLIIGCGGVASVAIHKCCQVPEVFTEICIASRTKSKCDKLAAELAPKTATKITTAQVDADKVDEVIALIKAYQPDLVMNIALPYQDLTIMGACLACVCKSKEIDDHSQVKNKRVCKDGPVFYAEEVEL